MKEIVLRIICIFLFLTTICSCTSWQEESLDAAGVRYNNKKIIVSTGEVERSFEMTTAGIRTASYIHLGSGEEFISSSEKPRCDWDFPQVKGKAKLKDISAAISDDEGFTSEYIEVSARLEYPEDNLELRYVLRVYPGAPGIRTQLDMKTLSGNNFVKSPAHVDAGQVPNNTEFLEWQQKRMQSGIYGEAPENITEQLATDGSLDKIRFWGYADGTQLINTDTTPILKKENLSKGREDITNDWASGMCLSGEGKGLVMVKESNKCFTNGILAGNGRFLAGGARIANTGSGYELGELNDREFLSSWATWTILYEGEEDDMQLALKRFDRMRYPVDPERDTYIIANTWGSSTNGREATLDAREDNVMAEIESSADLGIDIQQIDAGWEGWGHHADHWRPEDSIDIRRDDKIFPLYNTTRIPLYPDGWLTVRDYASELGMRLGLWVNGGLVPLEDLIWNYEHGGFVAVKYDFFRMRTKAEADMHFNKVREFIKATGHNVRVNWDVTAPPRIGYYLGKDLGAIYLANRKTEWPENTIYRPHLVLRDAWHLASYVNLNKFQVTVQNIERVDRQFSEAYKYSQDYSFAISMMATPIFFQLTQYYSDAARDELRPLIALYKQHREGIYNSYVFPIGEEPDNFSWAGFQSWDPEKSCGYITVFRELHNQEDTKSIGLHFLKNREIIIEDLLSGASREQTVTEDGTLEFRIGEPAGFRFYRYKLN